MTRADESRRVASIKAVASEEVAKRLRLARLLREVIGDQPDRWGYRAAYNVMNDDLRARIAQALEEVGK